MRAFAAKSRVVCLAGAVLATAGCALQKRPAPATVLKTEDFISDPATIPTEPARPEPGPVEAAQASPPVVSVAAASEGVFNVSAAVGSPEDHGQTVKSSQPAMLVDAKVGELNGRPIRVQDLLDDIGPRLNAAARTRRLTRDEWAFLLNTDPDPAIEARPLRRDEWMAFATKLFMFRLNAELENQLLAEEARASLKPEQKQGLKYMVEQATEDERRKAAGSRAAFERQLKEQNQTQEEFERNKEAQLLIGYQLEEKLRKRVRTSWRDVRLFYERNNALFNPPPVAYFRLIRVPANKPEAIAAIQAALDAGEPFEKVAAMPENDYNAKEGGKAPEQRFTTEYAKGDFFVDSLREAARTLTPGQYTHTPVNFRQDKAWLYLEKIVNKGRPLSDTDVQLGIATRLNLAAFDAERKAYIQRLKDRATFTDVEIMAGLLAEAAAERYWPKE